MPRCQFGVIMICALWLGGQGAMAAGPEPGQYDTTVVIKMPGQPPRTQKQSLCITPDMAKDPTAQLSNTPPSASCKIVNRQFDGTHAVVDMHCEHGESMASDMHTDMTWTAQGSHGTMVNHMKINGETKEMTMEISSKRVGDCTK